ncbi:MAG: excinuclease ABC subunit UvrC [Candidatus Thalassarchaeaceae archaeon]|nr:excinuclease ABC subunit UvrC [Candidatus Thalassarchaeaceae archaeon]
MPVNPKTLHLPTQPGVYLFKTTDGRVLYVGKATHLKDRVRSYFAKNPDRAMIPTLITKADLVDCIVTGTPSEALILERQLIREHKPRYNSLLKDDKSYPFIALSTHEYPRILYTRNPPKDAKRWGPFSDAKAVKQVIKLLRRFFGIRDNRDNLPFGYIESAETDDYAQRIKAVESVLNGDALLLIKSLQQEMDAYSNNLQYEAAARSRDLIAAVQQTLAQQVIHSRFYQECDAIGFANQDDLATIVLLSAEKGMIVGQSQYPLMHRGDITESVCRVLSEHYAQRKPPKTILVPSPVGEWMESWLTERRGAKVEVRNPQRGELTKLRRMADANAEAQLMRNQLKESGSLEQRAATDGAQVLGVDTLDHIVCFDMAQLQGEARVGASICLRNGRPEKKAYRTYTVKDSSMDDVRMMRHVVERWINQQEGWPDLLLIDGGVVHLNEIHSLLLEHGLVDKVPLATLAKREETIHRIDCDDLVLDRRGRVLVYARDEAHRFVNNFHRKRRAKKGLLDPLEIVEGLGAKRLQALLRHFGGRRGIDHASQEDLTAVEGIGPALAERIWREIH